MPAPASPVLRARFRSSRFCCACCSAVRVGGRGEGEGCSAGCALRLLVGDGDGVGVVACASSLSADLPWVCRWLELLSFAGVRWGVADFGRPPSMPSLRDGVEGFDDGGAGEEDFRGGAGEAFFLPPRAPSLEAGLGLGFDDGAGDEESEADAVALEAFDVRRGCDVGSCSSVVDLRERPRLPILGGLCLTTGKREPSDEVDIERRFECPGS